MVKPFRIAQLPLIDFGTGKVSGLPGLISSYGKSVLLVTGSRSFTASPAAARLSEHLAGKNVTINRVTVDQEPSPELIDKTVLKFMGNEPDVVVSIGGGSVIDAGKAISAMLGKENSVEEYLEVVGFKEHPGTKVPFIAVPTTSGTGSEATKNAVISRLGRDGFKRSLRHENLVPDVALVDPALTLSCPGNITAAAGMDCFTQLTEAWLSTKSNPYTDTLALDGLKAVNRSLVRSYTNGDDIQARSDMSYAALMSGICLANAGLGAVHGLAGTIGALFNIPHGVVCGTLMSAANEMNVRELRLNGAGDTTLIKYAVLGRIFADTTGKSDNYYIDFFLDCLRALTYILDLPKLSHFGITRNDLPGIASLSDVKNNPVNLSAARMTEILDQRL